MRVVFSRAIMMWMLCFGAAALASACGYLDDDLSLSDEEYAASFGQGLGMSGRVSGGSHGHGYRSGCGVGIGHSSHAHHGAHHPAIGRLVTTGHPGTTVIDMAPSHISARSGASTAVIVHDEDEDDEATSDAPIYAAGELETWGDYLEAELRRGQQRRGQARRGQ